MTKKLEIGVLNFTYHNKTFKESVIKNIFVVNGNFLLPNEN